MKQTGDKLANVFAVLSSGMLGLAGWCARSWKNNVIFFLWIDGPHLIVDFGATVEISSLHHAAQLTSKAAYHLSPSLDTASCVSKTEIGAKRLARRPSRRG